MAIPNCWRGPMKILLIADIHSNWPALTAIRESFDVCLFSGDLVDYATDPVPCLEWVRTHASAVIRGNHDHAVAQRIVAQSGSGTGFRALAAATRPLHWKMLNAVRLKYLARMPVTKHLVVGGQRCFLVHGTPRDPMDEYLLADEEGWRARLQQIDADIDFVFVGHTHIPFHLDLGDVQVVNPGSVGQPRDGDPRCSYAVIENGKVELRRVEYDYRETLQQMKEAGVDPDALEIAESVLSTGGKLTPDAAG